MPNNRIFKHCRKSKLNTRFQSSSTSFPHHPALCHPQPVNQVFNRCYKLTKYSVSQKIPPSGFLTFFPKRLGNFSPNFTHLLYVPIYARVQIFIQLFNCKIWTKNSLPFGKKCQKTSGGYFFDSHCSQSTLVSTYQKSPVLAAWNTMPNRCNENVTKFSKENTCLPNLPQK